MRNLFDEFLAFNEQHKFFSAKKRVLVAVSGGLDSMVLCTLLQLANFRFAVAHANFQLRNDESNGDEAFVVDFCKTNNIEYYVQQFNTVGFAQTHKLSIQEAARQLRYNWFDQLIAEKKFSLVATAHHLSDNIETVLFNLSRGTGIKGLRGMLPKQGKIARPLLFAPREALETFALAHKLRWREDSSNASDKYSRNFIRHQIVPLFKHINPSFEQTFAENIAVFAELEMLFDKHFEKTTKSLFFHRYGDVYIAIEKLKQLPDKRTILFTFLKDFGFNVHQVDDILKNLEGQAGAVYEAANARIIRDRRFLILTTEPAAASAHLLEATNATVKTTDFILTSQKINEKPASFSTPPHTIFVNEKQLNFPLTLRRWKAGDYFYPFGLNNKKKKLKKFLTDLKLPLHEKEKVWVLESNHKIVWVVGYRADERFKVNSNDNIVKISILYNESAVS
jgi:tRNA(Ile)-lysidine synthase